MALGNPIFSLLKGDYRCRCPGFRGFGGSALGFGVLTNDRDALRGYGKVDRRLVFLQHEHRYWQERHAERPHRIACCFSD